MSKNISRNIWRHCYFRQASFTELVHTEDCGQVSINISRPGITKGQHWHNSKWELFIVVAGHGLPIPPYAVYNIGNSHPENLLEFVDILQQELISAGVLPEDYDFDAHKKLVPMQPGDVPVTYADTTALEEDFGFKPQTSLREGLRKFAQWYAEFYK